MEQVKVQVIAAKTLQAALRRVQRSLVTRIAGQYLRGDKELLARNAPDSFSKKLLNGAGTIHLRRIEVGHSQLDPTLDRALRFSARGAALRHIPRALTDHRKIHPGRSKRFMLHQNLTAPRLKKLEVFLARRVRQQASA